MNDKEQLIKQKRTEEALVKGFIGLDGKIGLIVKNLGQPIIDQSQGWLGGYGFSATELPNYETTEVDPNDPYQIPTIIDAGDEEQELTGWMWTENRQSALPVSMQQLGWHFDGLSRGMHLEIKYDKELTELTVHYKGYLVFKEKAGDLQAYNPNADWEQYIEKLYKIAKQKDNKAKQEIKIEKIENAKKNKKNWVQKLRETWGI